MSQWFRAIIYNIVLHKTKTHQRTILIHESLVTISWSGLCFVEQFRTGINCVASVVADLNLLHILEFAPAGS